MSRHLLKLAVLPVLLLTLACSNGAQETSSTTSPKISGEIQAGLRVLTIDPAADSHHYRIYRGDYIRVRLTSGKPFTMEIPDLGVSWSFPVPDGEKPYIKVPHTGSYPFNIGEITGVIEALEFQASTYREVGVQDAPALLANLKPFILDVRTPREFSAGHIKGATLIPISELAARLDELKGHRQDPLFVYCRSGNRSTVASKFLVDAGFEEVINLRDGFMNWSRAGLPITK